MPKTSVPRSRTRSSITAARSAGILPCSPRCPGGGRQITIATAYEPITRALLHVTLIQYDKYNQPRQIVFAHRAEFEIDRWTLQNSSVYRFETDGSVLAEPNVPTQQVEIGESPTELVKRIKNDDPDSMSRAQIADVVRSGQLTESELRKYVTTYQEKLARPFACFVFMSDCVAVRRSFRPKRRPQRQPRIRSFAGRSFSSTTS